MSLHAPIAEQPCGACCQAQGRMSRLELAGSRGKVAWRNASHLVLKVTFANEVHFSNVLTAAEHTGCVSRSAAGMKSAFSPYAFSLLHALGSC